VRLHDAAPKEGGAFAEALSRDDHIAAQVSPPCATGSRRETISGEWLPDTPGPRMNPAWRDEDVVVRHDGRFCRRLSPVERVVFVLRMRSTHLRGDRICGSARRVTCRKIFRRAASNPHGATALFDRRQKNATGCCQRRSSRRRAAAGDNGKGWFRSRRRRGAHGEGGGPGVGHQTASGGP